jgi:hypothetical protein
MPHAQSSTPDARPASAPAALALRCLRRKESGSAVRPDASGNCDSRLPRADHGLAVASSSPGRYLRTAGLGQRCSRRKRPRENQAFLSFWDKNKKGNLYTEAKLFLAI